VRECVAWKIVRGMGNIQRASAAAGNEREEGTSMAGTTTGRVNETAQQVEKSAGVRRCVVANRQRSDVHRCAVQTVLYQTARTRTVVIRDRNGNVW